jgi:hypothetical protein
VIVVGCVSAGGMDQAPESITRRLPVVLLSFEHRPGRQFHEEGGPRNAVFLCRPCAEIGKLTAFGAERPPWVGFPEGRAPAERASHAGFYHRVEGSGQLGRMG